MNSYFDFNDYDNPVKRFIDDQLFFTVDSKQSKQANVYVMKAQTELEDELFQLGQKTKMDFATVQNIREYSSILDESDPAMVVIYIRYDSKYTIYARQVYSILQLLGDIGGLQEMLYLIGLLSVSFFARKQFISSVIKEIYQTKHDRYE